MNHSRNPCRRRALGKALRAVLCMVLFAWLASARAEDEPTGSNTTVNVDALFPQLGAARWQDRNAAQEALIRAGESDGEAICRRCFATVVTNRDPEVRSRIWTILRALVPQEILERKRGFLGVSLTATQKPVERNGQVVYPIGIVQVIADTPAEAHGIRAGENIMQVDDQLCVKGFGVSQLVAHISAKPPGESITLVLRTGDTERTLTLALMPRPALPGDAAIELQHQQQFERWVKESVMAIRNAAEPEPATDAGATPAADGKAP